MDPTKRLVKTPKGWAVAKRPRPQPTSVAPPAPSVLATTYDQLAQAAK